MSQRRGDSTGFLERRASGETLRRARRRNLAAVLFYVLLLVIPLFTGVAREAYAAAALSCGLQFLPCPALPEPGRAPRDCQLPGRDTEGELS